MTRLYAPAILLLFWAVFLAVVGDGTLFGVVALTTLAVAMKLQMTETRKLLRKRRHHG